MSAKSPQMNCAVHIRKPVKLVPNITVSTGCSVALVTYFQLLAGLVGPWMIGAIKKSSGSYVVPMSILAVVNTGAILYFAVLLKFLPVNKRPPDMRPVTEDEEALVAQGEEMS